MNKFFTFLLLFFGLFKMIKYLRLLPCLLLGFLNVSSQNLKLRLNTSLVITILFFCIASDGFSQNCPGSIRASGNDNRLFLEYEADPSSCVTPAEAVAAGVTGITYMGTDYGVSLWSSTDLRSVNGSGAFTTTAVTITLLTTNETCTYDASGELTAADGVAVTPPTAAGEDGDLCEGDLANPPTPTDMELFAALGGTPVSGGTWSNVGQTYTYTVQHDYLPCIEYEAEVVVEECFCYPTTTAEANAMPGAPTNPCVSGGAAIIPIPDDLVVADCAAAELVTFDMVVPSTSVHYTYWGNCSADSPVMPISLAAPSQGYIQQMFCDSDANGLPAWPGGLSGESGTINNLPSGTFDVGCNGFVPEASTDCICGDGDEGTDPEDRGTELIQLDFWLAIPDFQTQIGFQMSTTGSADAASIFVGPDITNMCEVSYFTYGGGNGTHNDEEPQQPTGSYNVAQSPLTAAGCNSSWLRVRIYISDVRDKWEVIPQIDCGNGYGDLKTSSMPIVAASSADDNVPPAATLTTMSVDGYVLEDDVSELDFYYDDQGVLKKYACNPATRTGDEGICNLTPTPVELISFDAFLNNKQVTLKWETAAEANNAGFEIQKSSNGRDWEILGWVEGNGTTAETSTYDYLDKIPFAGDNYYRLKQMDYDGQFEFSDIATVRYSRIAVAISPNPSPGEVNVTVQNPKKERMSIKLYDSAGSLIWQSGLLSNLDIWKKEFNLPQKEMYFISVQIGKESFAKKILIIDGF